MLEVRFIKGMEVGCEGVRVEGCVASCDELHRIDSIWRVELNSANSGLSRSLSAAPAKLIQ